MILFTVVLAFLVVAVVWFVAWRFRTTQGPTPPGSGTADPRPGGPPKPPTR